MKTKKREATAIVARPMTPHEESQIQQPRKHNFIEALPYAAPIDRRRSDVMPAAGDYSIRAPQGATQHIEMHTSMVDRALGHLIANVPMLAVLAMLAPVLKTVVFQAPVTVIGALTLWFVTFAIMWGGSWALSLVMSAEGIGLISELLKWRLLFREQTYRWDYWEKMNDDE